MDSFKIGGVEFGVGEIQISLEDGLLELEIEGDENVFDELCEDDDFKFDWAAYPPKIYIKGVPFNGGGLEISGEMSEMYDIAVYMMEHCGFTGKLKLSDGAVVIEGEADMFGERESIFVRVQADI